MIRLNNILVATDFSEPSDAALNYGREFARAFGATLRVLHVTGSAFPPTVGADGYVADILPETQRELEASDRQQLEGLLTDEDRRELRAEAVSRTSSTPADTIAAYAKEADANLLIMGTHGRSGLSHLLMGSVAEKVVRLAPCPVLTVRHPEREFLIPDALEIVPQRHEGSD